MSHPISFIVRYEKRISTTILTVLIFIVFFAALSCVGSWPSDDVAPPFMVMPYSGTARCPDGYQGGRYVGQGVIVCTSKAQEDENAGN
jgi:hypothetical protein